MFTWFSPSYDLLLLPEEGLMNMKPKYVAITFVTKHLPLQYTGVFVSTCIVHTHSVPRPRKWALFHSGFKVSLQQ